MINGIFKGLARKGSKLCAIPIFFGSGQEDSRSEDDSVLNNETKMMLLVPIAMNNIIRYVSMYPEVCFLDCTAGE
jgi:hypothetical protein